MIKTLLAILVLFIVLLLLILWRKKAKQKAPPIPAESLGGWTNNTIRKHGKSGKGIR